MPRFSGRKMSCKICGRGESPSQSMTSSYHILKWRPLHINLRCKGSFQTLPPLQLPHVRCGPPLSTLHSFHA